VHDELSEEQSAAFYNDVGQSERQYTAARRHLRNALVPLHRMLKVQKRLNDSQPLVQLYDRHGDAVGWALEDIMKAVEARLAAYVQGNPEDAQQHRESPEEKWLVDYKVGGDGFRYPMFDVDVAMEQTALVLLLPGKDANSYLSMLPLAFCYGQTETNDLVCAINQHVHAQLKEEVSIEVDGHTYNFKLRGFLMGDYKMLCCEFSHQGQNACMGCVLCEEPFAIHGCPKPVHPAPVLRDVDEMHERGAFMQPMHEWVADHKKAAGTARSKMCTPCVESWYAVVKQQFESNPRLAEEMESELSLKLDAPPAAPRCLECRLGVAHVLCGLPVPPPACEPAGRFKTIKASAALTEMMQVCKSMYGKPSAKTPLEMVAYDILHWHIRVMCDLIQLADTAAEQVGRGGELAAARIAFCGHVPRVTGWDGDDSRQLMQGWQAWTGALVHHPLYAELATLFELFAAVSALLMHNFSRDDPMVDEFERLVVKLQQHVSTHFSGRVGKTDKVGLWDGCGCHAVWVNSENELRRGPVPPGAPALLLNHSAYMHATFRHFLPFLRAHGSLLPYASWVLESSNRIWKDIIRRHVTHGGRR
jgi:hypothetical protein